MRNEECGMRNGMKLEPIARHREASYPTRAQVDANPEVLRRMPGRWRACPLVIALAGVSTTLMGCRSVLPTALPWTKPEHVQLSGVPNPPPIAYQILEADARLIIIDEAKKARIVLAADGRTVRNVHIPAANGGTDHVVTVTMDGRDRKRGISYVYVSPDKDIKAWRNADAGVLDTIGTDATTSKAALEKGIRKHIRGRTAVFLPASGTDKPQAAEELRKQVRDFITYLKAQGVI
jgi:hypothetical protein